MTSGSDTLTVHSAGKLSQNLTQPWSGLAAPMLRIGLLAVGSAATVWACAAAPKTIRERLKNAVLTNLAAKVDFALLPPRPLFLKLSCRMPHQPFNLVLTKLTRLDRRLKRKVKGGL